jgi:CO dehydrogenase maturation factor
MKLALAGKGGVGKTSIAGTLARHLARDGHRVLALDNDLNPNLSLTLGIAAERLTDLPTLPRDVVELLPSGELVLTMTLEEICASYALSAPDGVTLIVGAQPVAANTGCFGVMHHAVARVLRAAANGPGEVCILDTEASTEHLCLGTAKYADAMYAVVEPYFKSLETGRRIVALAQDLGIPRVGLIANQLRSDLDLAAVQLFAERHEIELAGCVPHDTCFFFAERAAVAPIDFAPDAPAILAIAELARTLVAATAPGAADLQQA